MNKQNKIFKGLIPFSGGIDSTAVLYDTLVKFPNDHFLVFHIGLISSTSANRAVKEKAAVEKILELFRQDGIENFDYKYMAIDYSVFIPPPVWDSEVINYGAAMCLLAYPEIEWFMEGAIADDYLNEDFKERLEKIANIMYLVSERNPDNLKIIFPMKDKTKYEVMRTIPKHISKYTWSCRYPEGSDHWTLVRCHKCPQCKMIDKVLKENPGAFPEFASQT